MDEWEESEERECQDFVAELLRRDLLTSAASIGVARQYVDRGRRSLTEKQRAVLDIQVLAAHRVHKCRHCGEEIPWSEQMQALDDGMCGYHRHKWERMMDE